MFKFFTKQKQERALEFKQMRKNLDSMKLAQEIETLFPNKVRIYDHMRELEDSMNHFIKQKLLNVKEDLLQNAVPQGSKRTVRVMAELYNVNPDAHQAGSEWKLRIEGRVLGNHSEEDILEGKGQRFLQFFEKVRIDFPQDEYPSVEWVKAKSEQGDNFDCIEMVRYFPKDSKRKQASIPIKVNFYLENNPKRYKLSPALAKVLGIEEESRLRIIGALW